MTSRRVTRSLVAGLFLTAAGAAFAAWWATRRQFPIRGAKVTADQPATPTVMPPSSSFRGEPEPTAVPQRPSSRWGGADDYESLSPEGLGSAFLAHATDSRLQPDDAEAEAELQGFQIATVEDLTMPEPSDSPFDFDIPERAT